MKPSLSCLMLALLGSMFATLSARFSIAQSTRATTQPAQPTAAKSYISDDMSIDFTDQSAGNLSGQIKMSGSIFPMTAKLTDGTLLGTFRGLDGKDVAFTGKLTGAIFTMDVNDHHYELVRRNAAPRLGVIGGIGVAVEAASDGKSLRIVTLIPDGPAEHADLHAGDRITAIGDVQVATLGMPDAIEMVRGAVGTQVKLTIESEGAAPKTLILTRERLPLPEPGPSTAPAN